MYQSKLPADPISLVLGIISVVIVLLGCCCGFLVVVSFGLAIAGLVIANKSLREYNHAPENYSYQSKSNVTSGKIVSIIGLVLSGLYLLIVLGYLLFYGKLLNDVLKDTYYNKRTNKFLVEDTLNSNYIDDFETDTLAVDSVRIDTMKKK